MSPVSVPPQSGKNSPSVRNSASTYFKLDKVPFLFFPPFFLAPWRTDASPSPPPAASLYLSASARTSKSRARRGHAQSLPARAPLCAERMWRSLGATGVAYLLRGWPGFLKRRAQNKTRHVTSSKLAIVLVVYKVTCAILYSALMFMLMLYPLASRVKL